MRRSQAKQNLADGQVHRWYRFVLAYPDHLVREVCERLGVRPGDTVLDPFCGTGTTLVECKKLGIDSIGVEANPACVFASLVKTNWEIDCTRLQAALSSVVRPLRLELEALSVSLKPLFRGATGLTEKIERILQRSAVANYLRASGMLERKWISDIPFKKTIALREGIVARIDSPYREFLLLALVSALVNEIANIRFGPELYCVRPRDDVDVMAAFERKAREMIADLAAVRALSRIGRAKVLQGDSRELSLTLAKEGIQSVDYVITSPPYPTEKDYTRNTRLELVYLGYVTDQKSLQAIKKVMIRSHSKGIYSSDRDGELVSGVPEVAELAAEMRRRIVGKTYGFAKLYPRIIEEYFGGMYRHFSEVARVLKPGGKCAYVVGEQRTYLGTYTPTAKILGVLAERPEIGLGVADIFTWRSRQGTTGDREPIAEEVLILEKPRRSTRPSSQSQSGRVQEAGVKYAHSHQRRTGRRSSKQR